MIAEFDAMVGEYMQAVEDAGIANNTYFVVTADHGDMQMEHQQFYKMVPYDASAMVSRLSIHLSCLYIHLWHTSHFAQVPLVISGPGIAPNTVSLPTQHVDLYPTIMQFGKPRPLLSARAA